MKIYSFYTSSHRELKEKWFLSSIKDDFELTLEQYSQECLTGEYMKEGWVDCMVRKVDLIIRAIQENKDEIFIHSDVDVQFFKPIIPIISKLMKNNDMLIQKESSRGTVCPGFLAARGNQKNLKLWQDVRHELGAQTDRHDQDILNDRLLMNAPWLLRKIANRLTPSNKAWLPNEYGIKWDYLPDTIYTPGLQVNGEWKPGIKLNIPDGIVLHHANWTSGIENKIAQLKYVRHIVQSRSS